MLRGLRLGPVIGGADLLGHYLDAGVVDQFTLTIAPVLLGSGKRL
ncbi:MAG: dihydrofolate reductase family protein [Candidatus Dormiibacterota bacterium]